MSKVSSWALLLAVAIWLGGVDRVVYAQNSSTAIRVLNASGVEGISGVVLLINPGDARSSQALVTNAQGEAMAHGLHCEICVISALDPHGLFADQTTEFASSNPSFRLVMQTRPLIDTVGDPKAASLELVIHGTNGEPILRHDVAIRPLVMAMGNNRISILKTDQTGRLSIQLSAGDYVVAVLNEGGPSEARLKVATSKEQCSIGTAACIVAPPSSRYTKPVTLQLASAGLP